MKVAIQGERGAFSHQAALQLAPRADVLACATSAQVFDALDSGRASAAVIPVENTLAGPVGEHLDLLLERDVFIHAEMRLRIAHNLIIVPGVKLKEYSSGTFASRGAGPVPEFFSQASGGGGRSFL